MWIRILARKRKENQKGGNKTRLQITTDYAIRMVVFLAQRWPYESNSLEIADNLGMSHDYVHKVASRLRRVGLIESIQGPYGGYRLAKDPEGISLYDVIRSMEGELCINHCLGESGCCSKYSDNVQACPVHQTLALLQKNMIATLQNKSIQALSKS